MPLNKERKQNQTRTSKGKNHPRTLKLDPHSRALEFEAHHRMQLNCSQDINYRSAFKKLISRTKKFCEWGPYLSARDEPDIF